MDQGNQYQYYLYIWVAEPVRVHGYQISKQA